MLDGRVKTMHPKITGAILAMRAKPDHMSALSEHGIEPIDMVVVNLYQFEKIAARADATTEDLIENIDIGGPTMIRSAAKNWQDVAIVTSATDYQPILERTPPVRRSLTRNQVVPGLRCLPRHRRLRSRHQCPPFAHWPRNRSRCLRCSISVCPAACRCAMAKTRTSRPRFIPPGTAGIAGCEQLHGKELSYNNLVDLDACWQLVNEFAAPAVAIIKHTNPAGCGENESLAEAYRQALACDPVSAFGGVIGMNREVDEETAGEVANLFVEAIAAPSFAPAALTILRAKKNLRLVKVTQMIDPLVVKSISGGFLAQTADLPGFDRATCIVKTRREPTEQEWKALEFAWKVVKHVKSNAIVYARPGQTVAVGAGQMSRVDSVNIAAIKAHLPLEGSVVGSDAFFPFPDGLEKAVANGATAFIQPGGSVNDGDVIEAADRLGVAMVFTGIRHFRH